MRSIERWASRDGVRSPSIWAIAAIAAAALTTAAMLPAAAAAEEEVEEPAYTSCSSAIHHISDLSEQDSSCTKARKVAKHAVKVKYSYSWSYGGFHCHGVSTEGSTPVSFTCKKSSSRIYFTYE